MRRKTKKDLNLSKLKTGCSPCLNESIKMQQKLLIKIFQKLKQKKLKKLYHLYSKTFKFDVNNSGFKCKLIFLPEINSRYSQDDKNKS